MCTLSWFFHNDGYELFFNRDESKTREKALPPQLFRGSVSTIMPIDPQGGGTWIAVNDRGVSFALLNYYQGQKKKDGQHSRGEIIKHLSVSKSFQDVEDILARINIANFSAFSLAVFCPGHQFRLWQCSGEECLIKCLDSPIVSSAVDLPEVCSVRREYYNETLHPGLAALSVEQRITGHYAYHRSHWPRMSKLSVCMHRADAETQSFTHISASPRGVEMNYYAGSLCSEPTLYRRNLPLLG